MSNHRKKDPFRAKNDLCFFSVAGSSLGRILASGINREGKLNNWWNIERPKVTRTHYNLVMMLQESSGFYANDSGFECPLAYGDFFIAFPGQKHRYAPGEKGVWSELCVSFEGEVFDLLCREKVLSPQLPVWHLEEPGPWLKRIQAMVQAPRPTTPLGMARETASFLAFLLEMLEEAWPKSTALAESDWFDRACVMLTADLSRPLKLREIANELGMSYETFRRNFRQRAGMSPGKYYDEKRRIEACDRLVNLPTPCWEIARYLGFCDEQHFSRRFKEWTGLSPRNYRTKYRTLSTNDRRSLSSSETSKPASRRESKF